MYLDFVGLKRLAAGLYNLFNLLINDTPSDL
jgi:hypothetical protein